MDNRQSSFLGDDANPGSRRAGDFYRTPVYQTRALLARLAPLAGWGGLVVEPCAGDGAIVEQLPADIDVVTNDLVARPPLLPAFLLDAGDPATWSAFARTGRLDVAITNPPFDQALAIAAAAFDAVSVGVALLLRLSFLEPVEDPPRGPWLAAHPPTRLIILPRHDYRGIGSTDSVTSAWVLWAKRPEFCLPGIEVVTVEERARLTHGLPTRPPGEAGRELRAEDLPRVRHAQ